MYNKIIAVISLALWPGFSANYPAFSTEAHRGGRGLMPENTIPAMKNAIDLGITTLEMDTHITADWKVILSHDEHINPLFTLSPEGKDISKEQSLSLILYKMNYADIKRYDVGSRFYEKYPKQKKLKTYIPLLAETIDSVQTYLKATGKKQVFYNIETKCSTEGDGVNHPEPVVFVKLLLDVIIEKDILPYVVIQSFDKRTLQIIHKQYPDVRTSYLVQNKKTFDENIKDLGYTPFIYSPAYKLVDAELVKQCHNKKVKILPWTVNTSGEIEKLKTLGVDGIITDYPDLLTR
ncbi:MAG: glycerophosphodiester phosphodiesterase [Sphingobacteriaceae bacterium]|nr:MAG: glycerophosphodiester phosphodiesterase [Sphingobacteriaceae bacterium]